LLHYEIFRSGGNYEITCVKKELFKLSLDIISKKTIEKYDERRIDPNKIIRK
jgi:hypothetical protein